MLITVENDKLFVLEANSTFGMQQRDQWHRIISQFCLNEFSIIWFVLDVSPSCAQFYKKKYEIILFTLSWM